MTRRGQALILVLWAMGLVSVSIGALAMRATHELQLGHIPLDRLQQKAIAQAAVQQAVAVLQRDDPAVDDLNESWATGVDDQTQEPLFEHIVVGPGTFSIGVRNGDTVQAGLVDEERKLNLNLAPLDVLTRLVSLVAPAEVDATAVAQAIGDWRDEAVGPVCQSAIPPCHNGPFDTVDELRLVPGVSQELFQALEPYVTVYGTGKINVNTASVIVLKAGGYPADDWVAQRRNQPFAASPDPGNPALTVTSTTFTVLVEATVPTVGSVRVRAVIDRKGHILSWSPILQ